MGHDSLTRRIAIEVRGTVNGAMAEAEAEGEGEGEGEAEAEGEARAATDGSEVDLRIETREDAIGWDLALVAQAVVDGALLAAPLAIDDDDHVPATLATQIELVDEDGPRAGSRAGRGNRPGGRRRG